MGKRVTVTLTLPQSQALLSVIGEVLASSPAEWGAATGRTTREANNAFRSLAAASSAILGGLLAAGRRPGKTTS